MVSLRLSASVMGLMLAASMARGVPAAGPAPPDDVAVLAAKIDRLIEAGYTANKVKPAPLADDAEFVRRIYLDLAGRIPHVSEVHKFFDDKAPHKRRVLVEDLLKGPHYANHFTNVWRVLLLPQNNNQQVQFLNSQIESWLRPQLRDNKPYDRMVRDLLTAQLDFNRIAMTPRTAADNGALAFFQANESKPENVVAASRLFPYRRWR
jgi:hypothetical protein